MKKYIPQYFKNNLWKVIDEDSGKMCSYSYIMGVFEDYAESCLYYSFNIQNKHMHAHEFESVLKFCFDYPESFNLNAEDKILYTERQLKFLNKLQIKCLEDNLKDIEKSTIYNIEELKKRNYWHIIENLKEDN